MGLFSWDCEGCGHPLIMPLNAQDKNGWMTEAVAITSRGDVISGTYDGYGRLDGENIFDGLENDPQVYHKICWERAGKPNKFERPSRSSADQGHFYGENEHNSPPPGDPDFFHADEERPKAACPECGNEEARQWDAFRFKCGDCNGLFVPGGHDDEGEDPETQGEDRPDES